MTRLSVVVPSYRIGGMDVLFESLNGQTFQDFEVVIADAIKSYRPALQGPPHGGNRYWFDGNVKRLAPSGGVALSNYSRSINDAVANAAGELIVIQTDYTWMPPDCLAEHWRAYEASDKRTCFLRDNHCTALPPLHPEFTPYGPDMEQFHEGWRTEIERMINEGADRYAADLESGKLDRFMWSIFAEPLTQEKVDALPITRSDVKQGRPGIDYRHASLKNEGIPTEAFLAVNGLDEDMDGSHLYQDQEFACRVERAGFRWTTAPGASVRIVNPRSVLSSKRLNRPMRGGEDSNEGRMAKVLAGKQWANPGRNLRAERNAALGDDPPDGRSSARCVLCGSDDGLYLLEALGTYAHGRLLCRNHEGNSEDLMLQVVHVLRALWGRRVAPLDPNEAGEGGE